MALCIRNAQLAASFCKLATPLGIILPANTNAAPQGKKTRPIALAYSGVNPPTAFDVDAEGTSMVGAFASNTSCRG